MHLHAMSVNSITIDRKIRQNTLILIMDGFAKYFETTTFLVFTLGKLAYIFDTYFDASKTFNCIYFRGCTDKDMASSWG